MPLRSLFSLSNQELCLPPSLSLSLQSKWPRNNAEVEGESEAS